MKADGPASEGSGGLGGGEGFPDALKTLLASITDGSVPMIDTAAG